MEEKNHIYPIFDRMMTLLHWNVNSISADCFAVSWMGIISVVELIITWDFPKRTGWKIFVV